MAGGGLIQRCVVAKAEVSTQKKFAANARTAQQLAPVDTVDNMRQGWVSGPETLQEAGGLLQSA
ncbi:hypothetical protein MesoLj131a_20520 [Mesorhizobium sp. 131-2-1]|nr:hypothetical protein MesoLj131a_20520 [Mesorhizobium sp. 131-2-1]